MAIIQEVKDGKFVGETNEAQSSAGSKKKNVSNEMGQDQFLQLLVAQMQYQDPLEPTSNTEWVAQMATFSMVESLNNMQESFNKQSIYNLVGKYVLINDGDNGYIKGKVDYITKQNGETKLAVNDGFYSLDQLDTVADEEYFQGSILANEWHEMVQLLPPENNLTVNDAGLVKSAREEYEKMTDSQKKFVQKEDLEKLRALETKMDALKATEFTGAVRDLPSAGQIEEADGETLAGYREKFAKASELYENLTESQRKNVAEETITQYNVVKEAMEKRTGQTPGEGSGDSDSSSDVSDILQKILDELKAQNGNSSNDNNSNDDSNDSNDIESDNNAGN